MNDNDKKGLIFGAKVLAAALWAVATIATCCFVWNHQPDGFIRVCSIALFAISLCEIAFFVKRSYDEKNKKDE